MSAPVLTGPAPGRHLAATPSDRSRVLLVDRGDALVGPLSVAMRERFDVVDRLEVDLTRAERVLVAGATFRPDRRTWAERFYKSDLAVRLRSRRARAGLARSGDAADVVFQTHALFDTADPRTVMYVDCTHRQSMAQWPDWNPLRGRALERWLRREREQYHRSAHVFAFSTETARSLVEQYGVHRQDVSVVGAGLNFEHLPAPRPAHHGHGGPPTVLFVGNDFERKGGPELLAAFALLRRRVPDARLRIVGAPRPMAAQDGVEHLGRVASREAMSAIYSEADVFCLPAHYDPFPGALLEAMAHGLPCVVTPTCGIPEMVTDGVTADVLAPDPAPGDLADALARLLLHPVEATRMGEQGRARVTEHFLWSHVLDRMAPVLDRLARPEPTHPDPPHVRPAHLRSTAMTQTDDRTADRTETLTSQRPWGGFEQLSHNETSTVKVITVEAHSRLSLQRHEHRDELWQVLDGAMDIEVGGRSWVAEHGEHVWVPAGTTHRMGNSGDRPARILEVAFGHFDEQDIERLEDDYRR